MINETPEKGTSIDYCMECAEKHIQTAKILIKEAIQRAEKLGTTHPSVLEKIRDTIAELTGCEDDTTTTLNNPKVAEINKTCRDLRRLIWQKKLAFGKATIQDLKQLYKKISNLTDNIYETTSKNYEQQINQLIKQIPPPTQNHKNGTEKQKPRNIKLKDLAEPTEEETQEALYKQMVKQYAQVYSPN